MLAELIARHLRTPSGWAGRVVARLMNAGNRTMNRAALEALELQPAHRVLEIGFGGASLLGELLRRAPDGSVAGLELSTTMLERARRRFAGPLREGALRLEEGTVERIPLPDRSFDRVLSVNTLYFWPHPEVGMAEIARVLAPGGRVVLGYGRVEDMRRLPPTRHGFRLWEPEEVETLMREAGLLGVESGATRSPRRSFVLTRGHAPGGEG